MNKLKNSSITKPKTTALIVAFIVLCSVTLFIMSFEHDWNITGFYRIGDQLPLSPYLKKNDLIIHQNQIGYDGQFFLSIALDPALSNEDTIKSLDFPRYRMKRILMPAISHIVSFGHPALIPFTLVLLNALFILLAVFFLNKLFNEEGSWRLNPLLYLCIPGIWVSFTMSTAEAAACSLAIISYYFYKKEQPVYTSVFILFACLTKETTILFWMGYLLSATLNKNWKIFSILNISLLPFIAWHLHISTAFTQVGQFKELGNFALPLQGHIEKIQQLFISNEHVNKNEYLFYFTICFGVLYLISTLPELWKKQKELFIAACGYVFIFIQSSMAILTYHLGYSRVFTAIYTIILLSESKQGHKFEKGIWIIAGIAALRYIYWFTK